MVIYRPYAADPARRVTATAVQSIGSRYIRVEGCSTTFKKTAAGPPWHGANEHGVFLHTEKSEALGICGRVVRNRFNRGCSSNISAKEILLLCDLIGHRIPNILKEEADAARVDFADRLRKLAGTG